MLLIIKLKNIDKEQFEKHLQSVDWHYCGWFKKGDNEDMIATKKYKEYYIQVCRACSSADYDYLVYFTPNGGYDDVFNKEEFSPITLAEEFIEFINIEYHKEYKTDFIVCELNEDA